jgi:hypothetical protein
MLTKKIRIRKNSYELIVDLIFRLQLNLLNKRFEFGELSTPTKQALSDLLVCLRAARTAILANCINQEDLSVRSKELNSVIDAIHLLKEENVLTINDV